MLAATLVCLALFIQLQGEKVIGDDDYVDVFTYPTYCHLSSSRGSALNTATHLSSLLKYFQADPSDNNTNTSTVWLQTAVNEHDDYGKLLLSHANQYKIEFINRLI